MNTLNSYPSVADDYTLASSCEVGPKPVKCWIRNSLRSLSSRRVEFEDLFWKFYPVYTENSPPRPKSHSVLLYDQPFSRYKLVENRKFTKGPQNNLNHFTVKSYLYTLNTYRGGSNFTAFCSTVACFPDNWGFWFYHKVQWWISKKKSLKIRNSKFQKSEEENSGKVCKY